MAKSIEPFKPVTGEESRDEIIAAFNRAGTNMDALHECVDDGFAEAKRARDGISGALVSFQHEMRTSSNKTHGEFLSVQGQMRALDDSVTLQFSGVEAQVGDVKKASDLHGVAIARYEGVIKGIRNFILVVLGGSTTVILGGIGLVYVNSLRQHAATHEEIAVRTAGRYTAEDGARDRATEDARAQAILQTLSDLDARIGRAEHKNP